MQITKMHGLGNDFIIVREAAESVGELAKKLCRRHVSVGADGLLVIEKSEIADIKMRVINADGSEAEMCGNGVRCFARYVYDKGIVKKKDMKVETLAGIVRPVLNFSAGKITDISVDMGLPDFSPQNIPVSVPDAMGYTININGEKLTLYSVLVGVPHTVLFCGEINEEDVLALGPFIEKHKAFPRGTNVNFVQKLNERTISMRMWERGAGRTLACGTGASAAVAICARLGKTKNSVDVLLEYGKLKIKLAEDGRLLMTGPAEYVFEGEAF